MIVSQIQKVSDIVEEVQFATREQALGVEQITASVNQLENMTQQNAALVEESEATSEMVLSQANELRSVVSHFVLSHERSSNQQKMAAVGKLWSSSDRGKTGEDVVEPRQPALA